MSKIQYKNIGSTAFTPSILRQMLPLIPGSKRLLDTRQSLAASRVARATADHYHGKITTDEWNKIFISELWKFGFRGTFLRPNTNMGILIKFQDEVESKLNRFGTPETYFSSLKPQTVASETWADASFPYPGQAIGKYMAERYRARTIDL